MYQDIVYNTEFPNAHATIRIPLHRFKSLHRNVIFGLNWSHKKIDTVMQNKDLFRLKIEAEQKSFSRPAKMMLRQPGFVAVGILVIAAIGFGVWVGIFRSSVEVESIKVSNMFVSRALTVLNASGYVVAQLKAAVSSKATGRIEHLYVEEGKSVKEGEIMAQLENRDLEATFEEAKANLRVARAALKNAEAELDEATLNYNRHKGTEGNRSSVGADV